MLTNHIQYLRIHSSRQSPHVQLINLKHPYKLRNDYQLCYIDYPILRDHSSDNDDNQYNINKQIRSNIPIDNSSSI